MRLLLLSPEGHDLHREDCVCRGTAWQDGCPLDGCSGGIVDPRESRDCRCDLCEAETAREDHPRALAGVDPVMP